MKFYIIIQRDETKDQEETMNQVRTLVLSK